MKLLKRLMLLVFIALGSAVSDGKSMIFDHDGGIDDFSALLILHNAKGFSLKTVTMQPADSLKAPSVLASKKILDFIGAKNIDISTSDFEGTNLFPEVWRRDCLGVFDLTKSLLPLAACDNHILEKSSDDHLVEFFSRSPIDEKFTMVLTGPLSNLAAAIKIDPSIKDKIDKLYIMGGAVTVPGNVFNRDAGTNFDDKKIGPEWNFYNNPQATHDVIAAFGKKITLVGLDAGNHVPVKRSLSPDSFLVTELIRKQGDEGFLASKLAYQIWSLVLDDPIAFEFYHFWDTLTACVAIDPAIAKIKTFKINVITDASCPGCTVETADGFDVEVVIGVHKKRFQEVFLESLKY